MIDRNFTTAAVAYRLTSSADDTRIFSASAAVTTKGILFPASMEDEAMLEGSFSEVKKFLCPVVDIRKSDKIVIGGVDYFVGGLRNFNNDIGRSQHLELILYHPN